MATGTHDLHKDEIVKVESLIVGSTPISAPVEGGAVGYKIARSSSAIALDGANPTSIVHGLTTVNSVSVTLASSAAPGDGTQQLSAVINSSLIDVYAWTHLSTDHTLIASTYTETFHWIAIGT
jgi:hypothetical protein